MSHLGLGKGHGHLEGGQHRRTCKSNNPTLAVRKAPPKKNAIYKSPSEQMEAFVYLDYSLLLPWGTFK